MEREFWLERWDTGQLGWHQNRYNPALIRHWPTLGLSTDAAVLVPMCGKSGDMRMLAHTGHRIVGVELARKALDEFFEEQVAAGEPSGADLSIQAVGGFTRYSQGLYNLYAGDFFDFDRAIATPSWPAAVYDRGALVALPPQMRVRYVEHLDTLLDVGAQILLIALEYEQSILGGPPFSVTEAEIERQFGGAYDIACLERDPTDQLPPRFREAGIESADETVFRLVKTR